MPVRKWILQYCIAMPIIFIVLAGVQYIKGQTLAYAVEFGVFWTCISVALFAIRRAYNFRKNIDCQICNDLPQGDLRDKE